MTNAQQIAYRDGRDTGAKEAAQHIRERAASAEKLIERGRLSAAEGRQLCRWLTILADDLEAGLHEEEDTDA